MALAAVVYFAFIAPNGPGPLSGIDVEDEGPAQSVPPERVIKAERRKPGQTRATTPAPAAPFFTPAPAGPSSITTVETPAGSQYQGAVDLILSRVSRAP